MTKSWEHQEKRIAKVTGGQRSAASGAFWSRKGDIRADERYIEAKWTGKKQYTLKAADLETARSQAVIEGRVPWFALELNGRNYVILTEDDAEEFYQAARGE